MPRIRKYRPLGDSVVAVQASNPPELITTPPVINTPSAASSTSTKMRRSHRKSRNGCSECKRRHIRCDESRPSCTNCAMAERECSYPATTTTRPGGGKMGNGNAIGGGGAPGLRVSPPSSSSMEQGQGQGRSPLGPHAAKGTTPLTSTTTHSSSSNTTLPSLSESLAFASLHNNNHNHAYNYTHSQNQSHNSSPQATTPGVHLSPPTLTPLSSSNTTNNNNLFQLHNQPQPQPEPVFTAQHLSLLHYIETQMEGNILANGRNQFQYIVATSIRHATDCPYLIDQILAFAAMHIAQSRPNSTNEYRHQATELQTRALAYFTRETSMLEDRRRARRQRQQENSHSSNGGDTSSSTTTTPIVTVKNPNNLLEDDEEATYHNVPRFLFAGILSLHVLTDTLAYYRSDFHSFIDRLVECFHLHRGIKATITPTWLDLVSDPELKTLLTVTRDAQAKVTAKGHQCDPLYSLIRSSDHQHLSASAVEALEGAVDKLQWAFDIFGVLQVPLTAHAILGFAVTVDEEYVDLLHKHQPEALVILAYLAVMMHGTRAYWVFGDAGAWLIPAIANHLGSFWSQAMSWPLQCLTDEEAIRGPQS